MFIWARIFAPARIILRQNKWAGPMGPWWAHGPHGPMGPWAHGPMGPLAPWAPWAPWAHGPIILYYINNIIYYVISWIDPESILDRSWIDPESIYYIILYEYYIILY